MIPWLFPVSFKFHKGHFWFRGNGVSKKRGDLLWILISEIWTGFHQMHITRTWGTCHKSIIHEKTWLILDPNQPSGWCLKWVFEYIPISCFPLDVKIGRVLLKHRLFSKAFSWLSKFMYTVFHSLIQKLLTRSTNTPLLCSSPYVCLIDSMKVYGMMMLTGENLTPQVRRTTFTKYTKRWKC